MDEQIESNQQLSEAPRETFYIYNSHAARCLASSWNFQLNWIIWYKIIRKYVSTKYGLFKWFSSIIRCSIGEKIDTVLALEERFRKKKESMNWRITFCIKRELFPLKPAERNTNHFSLLHRFSINALQSTK